MWIYLSDKMISEKVELKNRFQGQKFDCHILVWFLILTYFYVRNQHKVFLFFMSNMIYFKKKKSPLIRTICQIFVVTEADFLSIFPFIYFTPQITSADS